MQPGVVCVYPPRRALAHLGDGPVYRGEAAGTVGSGTACLFLCVCWCLQTGEGWLPLHMAAAATAAATAAISSPVHIFSCTPRLRDSTLVIAGAPPFSPWPSPVALSVKDVPSGCGASSQTHCFNRSVYIYICVCVRVCVHVCACCVWLPFCAFAFTCASPSAYTHAHACVSVYARDNMVALNAICFYSVSLMTRTMTAPPLSSMDQC